jgi:type IV pilus assembly protein PilO
MLASEAGLQMTGFTPGNEIPGEFYAERPVPIEVTGSQADLGRYLRGMADLPHPWIVSKFSFKAVDPQDARSPVRASITAQTYLLWESPAVHLPR